MLQPSVFQEIGFIRVKEVRNVTESDWKCIFNVYLIFLIFCRVSADIYSRSDSGVCTVCLVRTGLRVICVMDERVLGHGKCACVNPHEESIFHLFQTIVWY